MWDRLYSLRPAGQILVLFCIFLLSALVAQVVIGLILAGILTPDELAQLDAGNLDTLDVSMMQALSMINQLFWFGITSWLFVRYRKAQIGPYFGFSRRFHPFLWFSLPLVLLSLVLPLSYLTGGVYSWMEGAGGVWSDLLQQDLATDRFQARLIVAHGLGERIWILVVFALIPGILEEFLFRGILTRKLFQSTGNAHLAVWSVALLFALLHFQPAKLPAMIMLGALLGYIYILTGNLLLSILFHASWNALSVFAQWSIGETEVTLTQPDGPILMASLALFAIGLVVLIRFNNLSSVKQAWLKEP